MDEADLIDWYDVVEAAANGQLDGQACPKCGHRQLAVSQQGSWMRIRCGDCGEGFEGRMGQGRDDAFHAEADEVMRRQEQRDAARLAPPAAPPAGLVPAVAAAETGESSAKSPLSAMRRAEPWQWSLPAEGGGDLDGLSLWMDVVQSVHNGRTTGLRCPLCSEPLDDITVRDPYVRIRCQHCHEGFEGRIG